MGKKRKHAERNEEKEEKPEEQRPQRTLLGWKDKKPKEGGEADGGHRPVFRNREKVLVTCSRRIVFRYRHLMLNLVSLLPHCKKDNKVESKESKGATLNELVELRNCSYCLFFECRKQKDLYLWMARCPDGPSVKFLVNAVHTMEELKLTGNHLKGSRPLLTFSENFDAKPHWQLLKEMITQIFVTPKGHKKTKPFHDHVFAFSIVDDHIWFRNYQGAAVGAGAALLWGWEEVSHMVQWRIGNGRNIKFWVDPWGCGIIHDLLKGPDFAAIEHHLNNSYAYQMANKELQISIIESPWVKYATTHPRFGDGEDALFWDTKKVSTLGSTDIYNFIRPSGPAMEGFAQIWRTKAPPSYTWFLYLALHGRLLTFDRLKKFGIALANQCVLCEQKEETISHLFINCKYTGKIWKYLAERFDKGSPCSAEFLHRISKWMTSSFKRGWMTKNWKMIPPLVMGTIGKLRNRVVHGEARMSAETTSSKMWRDLSAIVEQTYVSSKNRNEIFRWLSTGILPDPWLDPLQANIVIQIASTKRNNRLKIAFSITDTTMTFTKAGLTLKNIHSNHEIINLVGDIILMAPNPRDNIMLVLSSKSFRDRVN